MSQLFQQRANMKRAVLLSAVTIILAACTGADKQECWKAKHNIIGKDCSSGNAGYSKHTPNIKVKDKKNKPTPDTDTPDTGGDTPGTGGTNQNDPGPDNTDTPDTGGGDNPNNPQGPEDNTPDPTPNGNDSNQNNSNDIEGYDPFDNLYGPGT